MLTTVHGNMVRLLDSLLALQGGAIALIGRPRWGARLFGIWRTARRRRFDRHEHAEQWAGWQDVGGEG